MNQSVRAYIWDFAGIFAGKGVTFIISVFLARLLLPSDFGLMAMIMVFVGVSQGIADAGFSTALVQAKNVDQKSYSSVFYVNLILSLFLTCTLFFAAPLIASFYGNKALINLTRILSFIFVFNSLNAVQNARLRRNLDFKTQTISITISGFFSGIIAIYLAYSGFGVWALVYQVLLYSIFNFIMTVFLTKWFPFGKFHLESIKPLWKFGRNLLASSFLESLYQRLDYLLIGKLFSPTELGYYGRGKDTNNMVIALSTSSLLKVFLPTISKIQDNLKKVHALYLQVFEIATVVIFFISFFLILNAHEIFLILFGEKWIPAVVYFQLMLLSIWAYPLSAIMLSVINGLGFSKYFFRAEMLKKILVLPAYAIAFVYGIKGYLIASIIIALPAFYINLYFLKKSAQIGFLPQFKILFSYLSIVLIAFIVPYLLIDYSNEWKSLLYKTLTFSALYFFLMLIFKKARIVKLLNLLLPYVKR